MFLVSDEARCITGRSLMVDGGAVISSGWHADLPSVRRPGPGVPILMMDRHSDKGRYIQLYEFIRDKRLVTGYRPDCC